MPWYEGNTIRFLNLSDYVNYKVTQEELANYGLDAPDLTVTVNYTVEDDEGNTTDQTFTLTVGHSQDQKDQAADGEEDVYVVTCFSDRDKLLDLPIVKKED